MSAPVPAPLGVVAHYNLLERLEPSGPGDLFRARDTRLGRTVTVRLLPPGYPADPGERARLFESARAVIALSHQNVTTLFDAGEHEGRVFLVFEYAKGQSLRAEMAGRPMNVRRAVELAIQIADGVAEAHGAGFIHGGLSPESIVITAKGHAKIPAFELASRGGFETTEAGMRLRDYEAPEEARGQAPDDRSDIYSVGAVLYEMLTTKRPPPRGAAAPSASNAHVPKELDEVVLRAAAPNPELRYQSVATLAAELRSLAAILDVRGVAGDEPEFDVPETNVTRVFVIAAAILGAAGAIAWYFMR
jgi:serine/threonine protein kinase